MELQWKVWGACQAPLTGEYPNSKLFLLLGGLLLKFLFSFQLSSYCFSLRLLGVLSHVLWLRRQSQIWGRFAHTLCDFPLCAPSLGFPPVQFPVAPLGLNSVFQIFRSVRLKISPLALSSRLEDWGIPLRKTDRKTYINVNLSQCDSYFMGQISSSFFLLWVTVQCLQTAILYVAQRYSCYQQNG